MLTSQKKMIEWGTINRCNKGREFYVEMHFVTFDFC